MDSDLSEANIEFTVSAQNFVTLDEAVLHMPKFVPIRQVAKPVRENVDTSVDDIIPEPELDPHAERKTDQIIQQARAEPAAGPTKKSFEKPYRRRQQNAGARPTVLAASKPQTKEPESPRSDTESNMDRQPEQEPSGRRRRRRTSGRRDSSTDTQPQSDESAPNTESGVEGPQTSAPTPEPVPAPTPVVTPKPLEIPVDAEENEDDAGFWSDDDEEPKLPESVQAAAATLSMEEDEPEHAPNPLVQKASKAVNLLASIKHQQEKQAEEQNKLHDDAPPPIPMPTSEDPAEELQEPDDTEDPQDSNDGYGELQESPQAQSRPKKVFRKRQTFRGRGKKSNE